MKGHPTRVTVRSERYSQFDPEAWWRTRSGTRAELVEFEKLGCRSTSLFILTSKVTGENHVPRSVAMRG
jgi:hypothetical protein